MADPATGDPAPQPLPGQYEGPPTVTVESRGHELRAARGSSCWSVKFDDGTGRAICADTAAPKTSEQLPVRGKRIVHIDLGRPSKSLSAELPGQTVRGPRRGDPSGRYWALRLPQKMPPKTVLYLFATFTQGDASYGVSLRRVRALAR